MKNITLLRRMIYGATGLTVVVILMLAFAVIPLIKGDESLTDPGTAVKGTVYVLLFHLLFLALLVGVIISSYRRGKAIKGLLIAAGLFLILLGLIIIDGAFAYIDAPGSRPTGIIMFVCVGFDLIAAILAWIACIKSK